MDLATPVQLGWLHYQLRMLKVRLYLYSEELVVLMRYWVNTLTLVVKLSVIVVLSISVSVAIPGPRYVSEN